MAAATPFEVVVAFVATHPWWALAFVAVLGIKLEARWTERGLVELRVGFRCRDWLRGIAAIVAAFRGAPRGPPP